MKLFKSLKGLPLYIQIFIGMLLGIVVGFVGVKLNGGPFISEWITPFGRLFIRLLQLIAIPLIFVSLIKGVTAIGDIKKFAGVGVKVVGIYMATTLVAVLVGLALALVIRPGKVIDASKLDSIRAEYGVKAEVTQVQEAAKERKMLSFLEEIVPSNIVAAMSDNQRTLQVIFFAMLMGAAAISLGQDKVGTVLKLIDDLYSVILKMVDYIIVLAPYGVAALMAGLVVDFSGDVSVFAALGLYALTVIVGLFILMLVFYPGLIALFGKFKYGEFIKAMYPVQLIAFTTSSSAAALPFNLENVQKVLGVSKQTATFVLPIGATINMDGTSCYQTIAVLFIAQVLGIDLSFMQIITIIFMTVLSSIGTPAIPGGSYVILTMVLAAVGIPTEALALILGVDRPLDMLRTSVNVTGDATVCMIVDKK